MAACAEKGLTSIPVSKRASRLANSRAFLAPAGIVVMPTRTSAKAIVGIESMLGTPTSPTLATIEGRRSKK
jgi:hypothetical protein